MNGNLDLVGKTITGVIATNEPRVGVREIWMLQFSDGTHVEFVSPKARKALRRSTNRRISGDQSKGFEVSQLCLNVA